ncbi:MAG: hypothetical protein V1929_03790 [bacterium]
MKTITPWTLAATILITMAASVAATYFSPLLRVLVPAALNDPFRLTTLVQVFADGNTPGVLWALGAILLSLGEGLVRAERTRLIAQLAFLFFWLALCLLFITRLIAFSM